jgi:Fas apoptotic inhibitory molecule (FAIM1)
MAERIWVVNIQGQPHKVRLKHGTITGKREIWLDDQQIVTDRHLVDFGSRHAFTVQVSACEVVIITNGFTFDYNLLVDGVPVEALGKHPHRKSRYTRTTLPEEHTYWQKLADVLSLRYIPVPGEMDFGRYRLMGYLRGFLVMVRYVYDSRRGLAIYLFVRPAPLPDPETVQSQVKSEIGAALKIGTIQIGRDSATFQLTGWLKKEPPEAMAVKINALLDIFSRHTRPLSRDLCEGPACTDRAGQDLRLVFINGFPQYLCQSCVERIPQLASQAQEEYQKAPSRLVKGLLAGAAAATVIGALWALVAVNFRGTNWEILTGIAAIFISLYLTLKVMDEAGTKRSLASLCGLGFIVITGLVLGRYLWLVIYHLGDVPAHSPPGLFQAAWRSLWDNWRNLLQIILYGSFFAAMILWSIRWGSRQEISQAFHPDVEIVEDIPVK